MAGARFSTGRCKVSEEFDRSEEYMDGWNDGKQDSEIEYRRGINVAAAILKDLIAELRDDGIEEIGIIPTLAKYHLERAEQRLKEIEN